LQGLRQRGFIDVHDAYLTIFQWPGPQGLRPTELAARARMSRQAINHLLGQLEAHGYLRRQPLPDHPRGKQIQLTARGHALGHAMREVVAEVEHEWARQLGDDRLEQLRALLADLCEIVQ
jgi:DNA-binding MarR family transcriptional regulator